MIVVTGGAGFIGSAAVWELNRRGNEKILVVDLLGQSEKFRNLCGLRFADYLEAGDFRQRIETGHGLPAINAVLHLGACSATTETDGSYLIANNVEYSKALAQWCLSHGVRFVYASSAATYGDGGQGYSDDAEAIPRLRPRNRYAFSKQVFDLWVRSTGAAKHVAGVKYFNVYGPNEYHKGEMRSVVHRAYQQVVETGVVRLYRSYRPEYGDGEQERDFVYVKDAVAMTLWLVEHPEASGWFNLGSGRARTWNELARSVFAALDHTPRIDYIEMPESLRESYQYSTCADMTRWRGLAGAPQPRSLEEGVRDYVRNHLATKDPYLSLP